MQKIIKKIQQIRKSISETKTKKDGKNEFSKYDYFTPEYINNLVEKESMIAGVFNFFSIEKNEFGCTSILKVVDIDSMEEVTFRLPTTHPSIKATNETQQYGGMMTYAKRYSYMNAYNIQDNSLDPDHNDNRPKKDSAERNDNITIDEIENKLINSILKKVESTTILTELESLYTNLSHDLKRNKEIKNAVINKKNKIEKK